MRLQSVLVSGYMHLQTDFKGFMQHYLKLADAFQMLFIGPKKEIPMARTKRNIKMFLDLLLLLLQPPPEKETIAQGSSLTLRAPLLPRSPLSSQGLQLLP